MNITQSLNHNNQKLNQLNNINEVLHIVLAINFYTGLVDASGKISKENGSELLRHANS